MLGRLTMLLLAALLLAACAGDDDGSTTTPDGDAPPARGDAGDGQPAEPAEGEDEGAGAPVEEQAEATLRVEIRNVGAKDGAGASVPEGITCTRSLPATCRETIECPVAEGGDGVDQRVCAWLEETGRELLLEEPEPGRVCTQVYGGPEVASVSGTLDGQTVDATFSREDGCAIARFDAISPLWTGVVDQQQPVDAGAGGAIAGACPAGPPDSPVSSEDPASGAADRACPGVAGPEPQIVEDPPEAFDLGRDG